jgi:hypothetical protein
MMMMMMIIIIIIIIIAFEKRRKACTAEKGTKELKAPMYTAFKTPHGTYKDIKVPRNFEFLHSIFHNNHHYKLVQIFPLEVTQNFQLKECNV